MMIIFQNFTNYNQNYKLMVFKNTFSKFLVNMAILNIGAYVL